MKQAFVCVLLFVCGHFCTGNPASDVFDGSSTHYVHRREANQNKSTELETLMTVSPSWNLTEGDTVVINCTAQQQEDSDKVKLQLVWTKLGPEERTKKVLVSKPASSGFSYVLGPVTHEHTGVYTCAGDGSVSQHWLIWVHDASPAVTLDLPIINRLKFFRETTVRISCRLPDAQTQWRIMRFDSSTGNITECPTQETSDLLLSCTATHVRTTYLLYWCESAAGVRSNILNISSTVSEHIRSSAVIGTKLTVSPAWYLSVGDTAMIECTAPTDNKNMSDKVDLLLAHTEMIPRETSMKILQRRRASEGLSFSLGPVTHEHRGIYTCLDDGTLPYILVNPWNVFIWVADESPAVTIDVLSHNRTQFFHAEVVTLGCQLPNDNSEWKIIWADQWTGKIHECARSTLSSSRHLTCTVTLGSPWCDRLFWCESVTGERSSVLNITNTVGTIVLESPPLPVPEGEDVTLRCLSRDRTTKVITTDASSHLYKNERHLSFRSDSTFTLKAVTKADEGLYSCFTSRSGAGHQTLLSVKARSKPSDVITN